MVLYIYMYIYIDKIYSQTPEHQLYFGMACQVA